MKTKQVLVIIMLVAATLHAQQPAASKIQAVFKPGSQDEFITITDAAGKVYSNARVIKIDDSFILRFVHADGAAGLPLADFPSEVKARFRLDELKALKQSSSGTSTAPSSTSTSSSSAPADGDIVKQIKTRAAQKWPGDFGMQEYVVKEQLESLIKLGDIVNNGIKGVPNAVLEKIKAEGFRRWPEDYSMMLYHIRTEVESWNKLQR